MAGLRLEMALLAGLGGGGSGGKAQTQKQQQGETFSMYASELEAALDERAAAARAVREELARWRQAQK